MNLLVDYQLYCMVFIHYQTPRHMIKKESGDKYMCYVVRNPDFVANEQQRRRPDVHLRCLISVIVIHFLETVRAQRIANKNNIGTQ